jgi:hypothetical protein
MDKAIAASLEQQQFQEERETREARDMDKAIAASNLQNQERMDYDLCHIEENDDPEMLEMQARIAALIALDTGPDQESDWVQRLLEYLRGTGNVWVLQSKLGSDVPHPIGPRMRLGAVLKHDDRFVACRCGPNPLFCAAGPDMPYCQYGMPDCQGKL